MRTPTGGSTLSGATVDQTADEVLLGELYQEYSGVLLNSINRIVDDQHLAEDVLQETLIRAWRHTQRLTPEHGSVRGWLSRVAHNIAIDKIRLRQARPTEVRETATESVGPVVDYTDTILTSVVVRQAFQQLGPLHRRVIFEVIFQDRTAAQAADVLGIPVGTVKSRLHHALRRLRLLLEQHSATAEGGRWRNESAPLVEKVA